MLMYVTDTADGLEYPCVMLADDIKLVETANSKAVQRDPDNFYQ